MEKTMNLEALLEAYRVASRDESLANFAKDEAKRALNSTCNKHTGVLKRKLNRILAGEPDWILQDANVHPLVHHGTNPLSCLIIMDARLLYRKGPVSVDLRIHGHWANAEEMLETAKQAVKWRGV